MSEPMQELQFTDEEIDHGVKALMAEVSGTYSAPAQAVRAVLRAVRAVPARCLNGGLAGHPAAPGAKVQGTGLGGVRVRGTVVYSYPVTTAVRTPGNGVEFIWTSTISSWDPSTDETEQKRLAIEAELGMPVKLDPTVPPGMAYILAPELLVADDDGMPCEEGR